MKYQLTRFCSPLKHTNLKQTNENVKHNIDAWHGYLYYLYAH